MVLLVVILLVATVAWHASPSLKVQKANPSLRPVHSDCDPPSSPLVFHAMLVKQSKLPTWFSLYVAFLYLPFCEGIEQTNLAEFQQNITEFRRILVYSGAHKIFRQPECGAPEFLQNWQKRSVNFSSLNYSVNPSIPAIFAGMRIPIFFRSNWSKFEPEFPT